MCVCVCVCVCAANPFILDVRFVDVPAGVTQKVYHTGFLCLPSAVLTLICSHEKDPAAPFPLSTVKSNFVY